MLPLWLLLIPVTMAQGVFQSDVNGGTGQWNRSSSWTLVSGSDNNGVPDANDDVIILAADQIDIRNNEEANNLTAQGTINYNRNRRLRIGRNLIISGNGSVTGNSSDRILEVLGDFDIPVGANANLNGQTIQIHGLTTVDGTLNFLSSAGDKTFGSIIINNDGNWNNTTVEDFRVDGSIQNDGIFRGCTDVNSCEYTFTANEATLSGLNTIVIPDIRVERDAILTNLTSVVINDQLTGNGTFINGTNSRLELQTGGPFNVRDFNASAAPNTVIYTSFGSTSLFDATYHDVIIEKSSGTISNDESIIINNDLVVRSGNFDVDATLNVLGEVRTTGGRVRINRRLEAANNIVIEGGEFEPNNSRARVNILGNLLLNSGEFDQNNGRVEVSGNFIATDGELVMTGGTVTLDNTYEIRGGRHDLNGGTFNTRDLNIASEQELLIGNVTFNHSGISSINGSLTVDAGSGLSTFNNITVNPGAVWDVRVASSFRINGSIVHNGARWTSCNFNGCEYRFTNENATLTGNSPLNFADVVVDRNATLTNLTDVTVFDRLAGSGTFINAENALLTYSGNNSSGSNFTVSDFVASATGNTVRYSRRNGNQRLREPSGGSYFDVVVDMMEFGDVLLNRDVTIDNSLRLNRGDVVLNNRRLIMAAGAVIIGGDENGYVRINNRGVLRQSYNTFGEELSIPIGDGNEFSPITSFRLTAGNFEPGAYVEFDITDQSHPDRDRANINEGGNDEGIRATAFISRYWTLTGSGIAGERFDATYRYVDSDVIGTESNMVGALYRFIPQLGIFDWLPRGIVTPGENTVRFSNADGFGDLYAMDDAMTRLPITLISFDAEISDDGDVEINWATASEENNALFTIERSINGTDFEPVLFLGGSGDSNDLITYMLTDDMPPSGRVFYRLKQTDFNGLFSRSQIVSVSIPDRAPRLNEPLFNIHGNPAAAGGTTVLARSSRGEALISISDIKGNEVFRKRIEASSSPEISIPVDQRFTSGVYFIKVLQEGRREIKKLLVR